MATTNNDQTEEIEQFFIEVTETEEYRSVEYLVFSIYGPMLEYFTSLRNKDNKFATPLFLVPLVNQVGELFCAKGISGDNILNYMEKNDFHGWVMYYDIAFIRKPGTTETIQVDAEFLFLIITGFILDAFGEKSIDINKMVEGEQFAYETNQYGLTSVPGVVFKTDSFIFDGKAYVYNILTNKSKIEFFDTMPGFAKIITEDVGEGEILLRLDERLAVPAEQIISYSTLNYEKFRGPQFHFADSDLAKAKTIIVHIDPETCDKLLMVIKKDYDPVQNNKPLPHITPHVFRHTFCTDCAQAGIDLKSLQYLMGHSDAGVTLNVYTHANYAHAADQMAKITEFRKKSGSKKEICETDITTKAVAVG